MPRRLEILGAVLGFGGAAITLLDAGEVQGDHSVTLLGDFLAFAGAVFVVGYIVGGKILRQWMPIFIYAFPVTLLAAILLLPASYLMEAEFSDLGVLGWLDWQFLPWFLALALISGLLGHTGLNTCLRYISPLVVSTSVTLEPLIGSLIGWFLFDSGVPGMWTILGGTILIFGLILVVFGSNESQVDTNAHTSDSSPVE